MVIIDNTINLLPFENSFITFIMLCKIGKWIIMKLFTSRLATKISSLIPLAEEQQGFPKDRSMIDRRHFYLEISYRKVIEYSYSELEWKVVPVEYIELIKDLDSNSTSDIRVDNKPNQGNKNTKDKVSAHYFSNLSWTSLKTTSHTYLVGVQYTHVHLLPRKTSTPKMYECK